MPENRLLKAVNKTIPGNNGPLRELGLDVRYSTELNRRDFLKLSSFASAGLVIGINLADSAIANASGVSTLNDAAGKVFRHFAAS